MHIIGCDIAQGLQYKTAQMHARMGYFQVVGIDDLVVVEYEVDVDWTGRVDSLYLRCRSATGSLAAQLFFDSQSLGEGYLRRQLRVDCQRHVEEILRMLVGAKVAPRGCLVNMR